MSEKVKTGGAAFPSGESYSIGGVLNQRGPLNQGMTLRDYFAARAMQSEIREYGGIPSKDEHIFQIAKDSYQMADAMLKVREAT